MGKVFVGLDWADDHHDVFVEDDRGRRLGAGRLPEGVDGVARFHALVAEHAEEPAPGLRMRLSWRCNNGRSK